MKEPCKKCGKKLGFLERSYKIENPKLGINYDALCGDCYSVQKKGIEKLEDIYQRMLSNLKQNKDVQKNGIDSVEIDLLILLAVEALLSIEPKFYLPETPLNQAFIRASEDRGIDRQKDIVRVVYKLLDYGFKTNLQNSDLDQIRNFIAYMIQNEVFLEDIEVNCGVKDELVKANVFISRRGVIIDTIPDQKLIFISIPKDTVVEYDVETSEIINEIIFHNLKYPWDAKKKVVLTLISENLLFSVANAMDRFNQKTTKLHEKLKKDSLEYFNSCVVADLKKIKPDEYLEAIHLDCLLLCIVKNLKNQNLFSMEALFDPKGTTIELLWAYYRRNLRNMGMDNNENIISYMLKNTLYTEGFSIKHGNKPSDKGWGFFTTKGYIIYFKRSKQVFFIYTENFPNAIYHPCSRVSYENKQYLQLIMNNGPGRVDEYRDLDELIKGSDFENLDLLPADFSYRNMDLMLGESKGPVKQLLRLLRPLSEEFDRIYLDCPPSISLVSENIFRAADALLVPTIPTTLSLRTYQQLVEFLDGHKVVDVKRMPFFSMVDRRKRMHLEMLRQLPERYPEMLAAHIPYASDVERMGVHRAPLGSFAPNSVAGRAYQALWLELEAELAG